MRKIIYIILLFGILPTITLAQHKSLDFDGSNDYVTLPTTLASNFSGGEISFSAWIYVDANTNWGTIIKNWGNSINGAFHFGLHNNTQQLSIFISQSNGAAVSVVSPNTITLGKWIHVAFVADGSNLILYENGIAVGSSAYNGTLKTSFTPTFLGAKPNDTGSSVAGSNTGYFNGQIEEVRLWNDARTPTEIRQNKYNKLIGNEANLVAYYPFDNMTTANSTSGEVIDESTNSHDGTCHNMTNSAIMTSTATIYDDITVNYTIGHQNTSISIGDVTLDDTPNAFDAAQDIFVHKINETPNVTTNITETYQTDYYYLIELFDNGGSSGTFSTNLTFPLIGTGNATLYRRDLTSTGSWTSVGSGSISGNNITINGVNDFGQLILASSAPLNTISTFPYTENFDALTPNDGFLFCNSNDNLTGDWTNDVNDTYHWTARSAATTWGNTGPDNDHTSGSGNFIFVGCGNNNAKVNSPTFDFSALTTPTLSFWYHMYGSTMGSLEVWVSTDGGNLWLNIWSKSGDQGNNWLQEIIDLTSYANQSNVAIRFRYVGGSGFETDIAIDDIAIYECTASSDLTVANVTNTAADLGWTENGSATAWDIEWGLKGFTQGTGTIVSNTMTNPHNLTGLTENTTYEFYVRAVCSANQPSLWVGPFEFDTKERPTNSIPFHSLAQSSPTNINLASGAFAWSQLDITLSGLFYDNVFMRYYNSQNTTSTPLGYGWSHTYHTYLTVNGNDWTVHHGDGHFSYFKYNGSVAVPKYIGVTDSMYLDVTNYILLQDDGMKYTFDNTGELQTIEDINGNTTTFTYTSGNLSKVTFATGRYYDFTYDGNNRIITVTDNINRTISFTYDGNGDLTQATTLLGGTFQYNYSNHLLTQVIDPSNNTQAQATYNADGKVIQQPNPAGGNYTYQYDTPVLNACTVTDPLGNTSIYYHDDAYRLIQKTDGLGNNVYYEYNDLDLLTKLTDEAGNITQYEYDYEGNLTKTTNPLGATTTYTYNALNRQTSMTDAKGKVTAITYDANGNITLWTNPDGSTIALTYNSDGQQVSYTDGNGVQTTYQYNNSTGDLTGVTTTNGSYTIGYDGIGRLTSLTDRNGNTRQLEYNDAGQVTKETNPLGNFKSNVYDIVGNLTASTDESGKTTTYTYNAQNKMTQRTNPLGNTVLYTYDFLERLKSKTDANGNSVAYTYSANGSTATVTNPLGTYTVGVDSRGNNTSLTDPLGNTKQMVYDALNRLISETDPLGNTTTYTYDVLNRMTKATDPAGNSEEYTYDDNGRLTTIKDALNGIESYTYDANDNILTSTNAAGQTTTYTYDNDNRLLTHTNAAGQTTTYTRDNEGYINSITDAKNITKSYTRNNNGEITGMTYADGSTVQYTLDNNGRKTSITNRIGKTTQIQYDAIGKITQITDPMGFTTQRTYDAVGNLTSVTDKNGATTSYTYNNKNQKVQEINALNQTTHYSYNTLGLLTTVTDANGDTRDYTYDANSQVTTETHALGTTTFTYDSRGNQTSKTNPLGHTSQMTYDKLGRLTSEIDPLNRTTAYEYNSVGDLTKVTNPLGDATEYTYNNIGQLTQVKDPMNGTNALTYDANGNILTVTDANGNTKTMTYNDDNQLLTEVDAEGYTTTRTYDSHGNELTKTDPNGIMTTMTYDDNNRITQLNTSNGSAYQFTYDNQDLLTSMTNANGTTTLVRNTIGQVTQVTDPHGLTTSYGYDNVGRRTTTTYSGTDVVTVTYNAVGLPTKIEDWLGNYSDRTYNADRQLTGITNSNGTTTNLSYDNAGQLTNYANYQPGGNVLINRNTLTYDAGGNVTSISTIEPISPAYINQAANYIYGDDNRLISTPQGNYTVNDKGEITADGQGANYTWGELGLLKTYTYNGVTTTNTHDAGYHLIKEVKGSTETRYQVDIANDLSQVIRTLDNQNNVIASYVQTPDGLGWRLDAQGNAQFYAFDYIGHTKALTDDNGNVTDTYAADPFGNFVNHNGNTDQPFQQWGKYGVQYKDNGHYHIRARDYQANIARFLSKDQFPSDNEATQKVNRYTYSLNNPMKYIDIDGFRPMEYDNNDYFNPGKSGGMYIKDPKTGIPQFVCFLGKTENGKCAGCDAGEFVMFNYKDRSFSCAACPKDSYMEKRRRKRNFARTCYHCPIGMITLNTGSTSFSDCTIEISCRPGYFINQKNNDPCTACPDGTYQSSPNSTSCISCPSGQTTPGPGAKRRSDCMSESLVTVDFTLTLQQTFTPQLTDNESVEYRDLRDSTCRVILGRLPRSKGFATVICDILFSD